MRDSGDMRLAGILVVGLVACQPMSFVEVQNHRPHGVHVELALSDGSGRWALEISHPAKAHVEESIDDPDRFFLAGRTIALKLVKRKR